MIRQATLPLLFVLSPALRPDPAAALERRLRKAVHRPGPIAVGTPAAPYAPRRAGSPLGTILRLAEGRQIAITTGSPYILREVGLLVELDRRHSVAVRMVVPVSTAQDPGPWLCAVRGLAAEGIATSVRLAPVAGARGGEETLRAAVAGAREAGALDIELDPGRLRRGARAALLALFRRLRLEHGFPRGAAGRG